MRHSIAAGLVHQPATMSMGMYRRENMWMTGKDMLVLAYEYCFLTVVFSSLGHGVLLSILANI